MVTKRILVLLMSIGALYLNAQTNIRAWQADGQVWVVWEFGQVTTNVFSIFKATSPSIHTADWEHVGSIYPEHSVPYPIRSHLNLDGQTWRIPDGNNGIYELKPNEGLFVETIRQGENNHYAVLSCTLDDCQDLISTEHISENLSLSYEPTGQIKPHLQHEETFGLQQKILIYTLWVEGRQDHRDGLPNFPIMGNAYTNGWPHYFAIWTGVNASLNEPSPAINWLHGGSGNFAQYLSGKRKEINIEPDQGIVIAHHDDFYRYLMGNRVIDESNSWWYGWAKNHNPFDANHSGPENSDTLVNYTQRRIKWINDWLISKNIIDSNRISIQGYSVGSAGAFGMMKQYPEFFSSGSLFNCGQQGPDQASFGSFLLGTREQNLPTNLKDKHGNVLHIHDLYGLEIFTAHSDMPLISSWHGKNDINPTMGWDKEFLNAVKQAKSQGMGYQLFWDERAHPIQNLMTHWSNGPNDADQTAKDDTKHHERYRNDRSYPVFYNYQVYDVHHSDPGNGQTGTGNNNGDDWGTWGGYHEFDLETLIDKVDAWSCTYYLSGVNAREIDQYSGPEDCIQSDFTLRRPQNFKLAPLEPFDWQVTDGSGEIRASGNAIADQEGRAVLKGLTACKDPQKLTIELYRNLNQGCNQEEALIPAEGVFCQSLLVNSVQRDFLTIVPPGYNHNEPYGLLFAFHGGGGNFRNFAFGHINENGGGREEFHLRAAEENMILVYPQALIHPEIQASTWNTFEYEDQSNTYADDFQFTIDLLNHHAQILNIDKERIYASGYSKGGDFAQLIGRRLSCYFAGVTSVGSSSGVTHELGGPIIEFYPIGDHPVPVLMIKGDQDFKRPWNGGLNNNNNLVPSGLEDIDQWVQNNHCMTETIEVQEVIADTLTQYLNIDCNDNTMVKMLQGHILEHVWPDQDDDMGINANSEFIDFLKNLRNPNSCLTTKANNFKRSNKLSIYPNPSSDEIHFRIEAPVKLQVLDIQGNILLELQAFELTNDYTVDISELPTGFYIAKVLNAKGSYTGSFIRI